jgi:hypothetical protein
MRPEALAAARDLIELLQEAHFAARRMEDYLLPERQDRLVDRLHAARVLAQQMVQKLGA